jgi:hypothetical protein
VLLPLGVVAFGGWRWYSRVYRPRRASRRDKQRDHLLVRDGPQQDVRDLNV